MIKIIIQARLGSSRLPNKMILPFYEGKGVFELTLLKLLSRFEKEDILVATTTNKRDDEICNLSDDYKINYYRGDEENVLKRFVETAESYKCEKVIRVCPDNPFLDMEFLLKLYHKMKDSEIDYCSFQTSNGVPSILTHYGFWAEGIKLNALKTILKSTNKPIYLEHVTNYIYGNKDKFETFFFEIDREIEKYKNIRLTLDTPEDFILLKKVYSRSKTLNQDSALSLLKMINQEKDWIKQMKTQIKLNTK